jgi:hypothetical protein
MEMIALAVLFSLGFVPLVLATELAAGHPDTARQVFSPSMDAGTATHSVLASPAPAAELATAAANDEHERQAA